MDTRVRRFLTRASERFRALASTIQSVMPRVPRLTDQRAIDSGRALFSRPAEHRAEFALRGVEKRVMVSEIWQWRLRGDWE